ncbi:MAG: LacI family transcriptional regulator [Phycisphaerae bacterium]|nr:LacI family transcriptional regulator [Phycisphaerae bacterium]
MKTTISKMAQLANVSEATVSRAINNKPEISKQTRQRILTLARQFNYQPNIMAKSLRSKRTHTIGLILADIENPYFAALTKAVERKAISEGYHVLLGIMVDDLQQQAEYVRLFQTGRVDGILLTSQKAEVNCLSQLDHMLDMKRRNFPFVYLGGVEYRDVDYITHDNELAAYNLISHLIDLGHRKIGFLHTKYATKMRELGYRKALADHDIPLNDELMVPIEVGIAQARQATEKLLNRPDRPTAIVGINDFVAFGVLQAVREFGLSVPQDVAVAGFDNIELVQSLDIPLTTVAISVEKMADEAINLLLKKIEGKKTKVPEHITIEPELIIRQSTQANRKKGDVEPEI